MALSVNPVPLTGGVDFHVPANSSKRVLLPGAYTLAANAPVECEAANLTRSLRITASFN
jgi:hypothetical protein